MKAQSCPECGSLLLYADLAIGVMRCTLCHKLWLRSGGIFTQPTLQAIETLDTKGKT